MLASPNPISGFEAQLCPCERRPGHAEIARELATRMLGAPVFANGEVGRRRGAQSYTRSESMSYLLVGVGAPRALHHGLHIPRVSHYIEGDIGQWIVANWQNFAREATLYADIIRSDTGELSWNDPLYWGSARAGFGFRPFALKVAEALERLGVSQAAGLRLVGDIWGAVPFTDLESYDTACGLIRATIEGLAAQGLVSEAATNDDVQTLYRGWQMPMYDLDFKLIEIPLTDLQEDQERYLYRERLGY
jgi:hypothetical protein